MTTFGKGPRDIENSVKTYLHYESSPIIITQHGTDFPDLPDIKQRNSNSFSDDTDDLSTLGVPVGHKDDPDPLSAWNELEPELEKRRSKNFEDYDGPQKR